MDETEDEEVKRNCYGRKLKYESSCDESDSESESDHEPEDRTGEHESPAKLVTSVLEAKCFGTDVLRPVARSLSFPNSDNDMEEKIDSSEEESILSVDERSSFSLEASESDDNEDDKDSEPESDLESTCDNTDSEVESDVPSEIGPSDSDLLSIRNEVSMSDDESTFFEDQESNDSISIVAEDTSDIEHERNDDLDVEIEFQSSCDEEFVVNHLSRSDSSCSVDLLDIEVENLIGEKETMTYADYKVDFGILSKEEQAISDVSTTANRKRKFSPDTSSEIVSPDLSEVTMKRNRSIQLQTKSESDPSPPILPAFSSFLSNSPFPTLLAPRMKVKETLPIDEQEIDNQLAEELSGGMLSPVTLESDPVPFLTPPASPITTLGDDGVIICEWPSNLVVDSAYSSAIELRALSPSSLLKLEVKDKKTHPSILQLPRTIRRRSVSEGSSII